MLLDRDEFVVTFDPSQVDTAKLIATIKESGYASRVVSGKGREPRKAAGPRALPAGVLLLDEALSRARSEHKPIVLDFFAKWCAPCQRMEKTTFKDKRVAELLGRTVFVRVDTDRHPSVAKRMGVEGLPDIRFVLPDGRVIRELRNFQDADSFSAELEDLLRKAGSK